MIHSFCLIVRATLLLLAPLVALRAAYDAPVPPSWSDDFSDPASFAVHWRPYGFLTSGIDAAHPLGETVSGKDARPEWWQIVDGALRGQCFPEEQHPPGLRRAICGTDIRLHCRFKIAAEGQIGISIGGPNPIVERDFNVAGLHIRADGITAWDNDVLHPKEGHGAEGRGNPPQDPPQPRGFLRGVVSFDRASDKQTGKEHDGCGYDDFLRPPFTAPPHPPTAPLAGGRCSRPRPPLRRAGG